MIRSVFVCNFPEGEPKVQMENIREAEQEEERVKYAKEQCKKKKSSVQVGK